MKKLIAYHGQQSGKDAILAQLKAHREADELVQRHGYWEDGKGCAVGCTLHSGEHSEYEPAFGIPVAIARLEDSIFEGLPVELARQWPERLMSAIRPGADLSLVSWKFLHWLLTTPSVNPGIEHPLVRKAVADVASLIERVTLGEHVSTNAAAWSAERSAKSAARSANSAARSAAAAANSAAWSAEWSAAWSAESADARAWSAAAAAAESAAWSAESAAWSADARAWSAAAESAAWSVMSDKLVQLIQEA